MMLGLTCINGIFQLHILVKRVILGCSLLVAVAIIDGRFEFDLFGK